MELDPASLAQALATVVGLLCNFRQERGAREALDHRDFVEWLEHHHHEEIKNLILRTHQLPREIDDLLRKDQKQILEKLSELNAVFAAILSKLDGFSGLVSVMAPGAGVSEQAQRVLVSFANSDADFLVVMDVQGKNFLLFSPGNGRDVPEPRFLHDDVTMLVAYNFLSPEYGGSEPMFRLTRNGATFAKLLKESGVVGDI
jgi:hypothetical protein